MGFDEYEKHDAVSLAALVNSGEISETELLDESLSRMRAIQPELNAVTCDMEPFARAAIAAGVPNGCNCFLLVRLNPRQARFA